MSGATDQHLVAVCCMSSQNVYHCRASGLASAVRYGDTNDTVIDSNR